MKSRFLKKLTSIVIAAAAAVNVSLAALPVSAQGLKKSKISAATPRLVVDMLEDEGDIMHGASGFLYGISSEGVPENSLIVPLKPKVLASKGALGTEHPYGDALDVAESFFKSGGEMVQMYCSNYYAIFGPQVTNVQYAKDLKEIIVPSVVKWKQEWNDKHGTPDNPKDELGKIDIDKAIVYLPINEGSPQVDAETGMSDNYQSFYKSWKLYYDAIKEADPKATVGGPNDAAYGHWRPGGMKEFLEFCAENNCWPDVQTWHQLDDGEGAFERYPGEVAEYRQMAKELNMPENTIVINEYATMEACGVPGILIRYISMLEHNKTYACLPFWHQANNLNDLAADANEPNSAWWFYKWYADMTGKLLKTTSENTTAVGLNAVAAIDSEKSTASVLFGGVDGASAIVLRDLAKAKGFEKVKKVNVTLKAAHFKGFSGACKPETLVEGVFELDGGHLVIDMDDMIASSGYSLTATPASDDADVAAFSSSSVGIYEAESAELLGQSYVGGSGGYYASGRAYVLGVNKKSGVRFNVNIPADGNYKLELVYGNGTGTDRGNEDKHGPKNVLAELSIDDSSETIVLENTMLRDWSDIYSMHCDLKAGEHTIIIKGLSDELDHNILLDVLFITYSGAYGEGEAAFDILLEAEDSEFNQLASVKKTAVATETKTEGYSGRGYISGLEKNAVRDGGGIRLAVNVPESGLYSTELRYIGSADTKARIYVGNTVRALDGVEFELALEASSAWSEASTSVYLQKGMNIIDIDAQSSILLDSVRISSFAQSDEYETEISAVDAVPSGADTEDVSYYVWKVKADDNGEPELYKEFRSTDKTAVSSVPSGIEYVVGRSLSGDVNASSDVNKYLEFTYNADEAGTYALRIFHSNDEIFGTHGYNTKIIDKYLCVQVNGGEAKRYFFINSLSKDTFKEKTVYIDLEKGENKIKLFNDDSWSVIKGLDNNDAERVGLKKSMIGGSEQGYYMDKPGDIPITNSMPNLSKFIIMPAQVNKSNSANAHKATFKYSQGGIVSADKNTVSDGGSVTFTVYAEQGVKRAMLNGNEVSLTKGNDGEYRYTADKVSSDVELAVEFERTESGAENRDPLIANNSFGTGNTDGWKIKAGGKSGVESSYFDRFRNKCYLKVIGNASVENIVKIDKSGVYELSFVMKNKGYNSERIGGFSSIELYAAVDKKEGVHVTLVPTEEYSKVTYLVNVPEDNSEISFVLKVNAKSGFETYLDDFTITKSDIVRDVTVYLVDSGDHDPETRPKGGRLGENNSLSDMIYGTDPKTGKMWGLVDYLDPDGTNYSYNGDSKGVFTEWTRPDTGRGTEDNLDMNATFRFACGQDGSDRVLNEVGEVFIDYKFELEPHEQYDVFIGLGNEWNNSSNVNVYANYVSDAQMRSSKKAQTMASSIIEESVIVPNGSHVEVCGTVWTDLDGFLTISLRRPLPAENTTINLNYIIIRRARTAEEYKDSISDLAKEIDRLAKEENSKTTASLLNKAKTYSDDVLSMEVSGNDIVSLTNAENSLKNIIAMTELDLGNESGINTYVTAAIIAAAIAVGAAVVCIVVKRKKKK